MGNYLSPNEQQLYHSLESQFIFQQLPYLLHRKTNQMCTLHKITSNSQEDNSKINQVIEEYTKTRCESISQLITHSHLDMRGYCSNQQNYYLIFKGINNYTMTEELVKRKFQQETFSEEETIQIIETYLNGLREYSNRFQRDYERLWLHSLAIDKTGKMHLQDPWLITDKMGTSNTERITELMLSYPSPEKLKAAFNSKMSDYDIFESNLFSVGAIGLDLYQLDKSGRLYTKKQINFDQVQHRLKDIKNLKLKNGLQCLLNLNPKQRTKIYQAWGVDNKKQHFINVHGSNKKSQNIQGKQQSFNHDLAETRKKFNFAKIIPQNATANAQDTRQMSPIRQTDSLWNNITPILHLKSDTNQVVSTEVFRMPSPPKTKSNNTAYQNPQAPKISFNDSKLPATIITPQTASLSNSATISGVPQINHISPNQQTQFYQKKLLNVYQPASSPQPIQNNKAIYQTKPVFNQTHLNIGGERPLPSTGFSSISPILGTIYKQSFTFDESSNNSQQNNIIYNVKPSAQAQKSNQVHQEGEIIKKQISPTGKKQQQKGINSQEKPKQQYEMQPAQDKNGKLTFSTDQKLPTDGIKAATEYKQAQKQSTPHRPTAKNKHNSTIVEAREQDSPNPSLKSENNQDQQYVMEEYGSGSRYEGFKSNGMRNGQGRFYYQDGGYYEGNWRSNKMDGIGKLYYENGKLAYEGSWSQDQFNGLGKVYNDTPIPFKESFDYTNFDLLGDYWQYYEGMLMKDTKEGRGKIKLSNGQQFEGDFHKDRIQGFGKFHTLDGKVVEGIWREARLIKVINHNRDK